jgi:hypothetical protein
LNTALVGRNLPHQRSSSKPCPSVNAKRGTYSRGGHRRKDVEKIIRFRHGLLPQTDDADLYVKEIAECHGRILFERRSKVTEDAIFERLDIWCTRWAPTFPRHLRSECAAHAKKQKGQLSNDEKVGVRLRLRHEERTFLDIRTIGCYDVDKKTRKLLAGERKRKRDKERKAQARILEGRLSRPEYLAANSVSREQPWLELEMSRRTYYRRKKAGTLPERTNIAIAAEQLGIYSKAALSSKVQGFGK